jgi:hypothetical protein
MDNIIDEEKAERIRAMYAARKANEQRLTRINRVHVEVGIAAFPELGLAEELRNIGSDFSREELVSILERAEKLGREEMEKRSRKAPPPAEDRTPIPESAWEIAERMYEKHRGGKGV